MKHQHQILRTLQSASAQSRLAPLFADEALMTQTALAHAVCREFGFFDAAGKPQGSTCIQALRVLASRGRFTLPAPLPSKSILFPAISSGLVQMLAFRTG